MHQLNRVRTVTDNVSLRTALISVWDKSGLDILVGSLYKFCPDVTVYSTGGTYETIREISESGSAISLKQVSEYTGQPEMQGGLVKTLDYSIYLGLLSESDNPDHAEDLRRTGVVPIDLVVCNLYPFSEIIAGEDADLEDARAHIDIGGPCMLRAAAKNYLRVLAVCDPEDYAEIGRLLEVGRGTIPLDTRITYARKVFKRTSEYDTAIHRYFEGISFDNPAGVYDAE
jgi:phosphoribosylaminoimidazolecarboxamide formyltransferase / IMP cyclohydrolase